MEEVEQREKEQGGEGRKRRKVCDEVGALGDGH